MNKLTDILDGYVKPPYSLEDSMKDAISEYYYKSHNLLNKVFQNCFIELTNEKNKVIGELKNVLSDNCLDENTIAIIVDKIDSIIFTHYDYDEEDLY